MERIFWGCLEREGDVALNGFFFLKLEDIDKDWRSMAFYGFNEPLEVLNRGKHKEWQTYYDLELAELVYDRYKIDFENFGYKGFGDVKNSNSRLG